MDTPGATIVVRAAWVLPISHAPIADGAVAVADSHVVAVGRADEVVGEHPGAHVTDLGDVVVTPGLVNAHTHLALSAAAGLLPPDEFPSWLAQVPAVMRAWDDADLAASAALGAVQSLAAGVTAVGEIVYARPAADAVLAAGLGATLYWEVLGVSAGAVADELERAGFPMTEALGARTETPGRHRFGLSPHSPYTSGPALLQGVHELAAEMGAPFAIHAAESAAETRLMRDGDGPLAAVAARLAIGFDPPHTTSVAYLDSLGVLDDALVIHLCEASDIDAALLARSARGVVVCPRSNVWLSNRPAPAVRFAALGIPIAVGTDSAASNEDLDVLADVRALAEAAPALSASRLLRAVTADAADAIGLAGAFGALEPGRAADLAAWAVDIGDEPEAAVVREGGRTTLRDLMVAGAWRTRDGRPLDDVGAIERAAAPARKKAAAALADFGA